jgi:hypothetical protein
MLIHSSDILYNSTLNTFWGTASKLCISLKYVLTECRLLLQHELLRISKDSAEKYAELDVHSLATVGKGR